ncbi:hypothetical protein [Glutamicibacter sp.]|uniref:hypothetical protein n=1 Tax=Glutamicibacter sp. TaxID=1931995 RepID=UPI0028BD3579|nr:hypothetical protein [Glutamicibacter sp.]
MRPKLISLLAVPALLLVGCSTAEPAPSDPAASSAPTASATPTATATDAEEPATADDAAAEAAFLEGVSTVTDKASQLPKNLRAKAEDSYLLKRGKEYCETIAKKGTAEPEQTVDNADDLAIESMILTSARIYLCPAD